ncbi:MAG: urea ABC transporter ATP-binding subunit UrtE [Opitutus sp.]|nr:urea ABC transporter ATP-binding subunit UrtE [Opitutus sp.]MCS6248342.1 urea ABC transporter ATP-binding subunit UrtE [Opitutus sp.]MCS6275042.1 urea ABC transporter ATP-binding subunit UrtE [Opitutus sp.]MCS6278188.1 urea ABC transporter ATP-binding subunit UrtE [Opitutus sp.]MCS6299298.1 urea ABC transporter ATP-binding subunit UrtE [Opitutus sp.]
MLTVSNLQVGYGLSRVIQDVSFTVGDEEILAIMGRNGMGKSTLLKALVGMHPSKSGRIMIDGVELQDAPSFERVRQGIAFVPQGRMIFPYLTVVENMLTGARGPVDPSTYDEIYTLFPVLHEMRKRKGGNLSGGQQQQLAIARALITNPKVLILDEPTEGIQPSIIKDIARALREIRKMRKISILVTEQVVSFMMDSCDRAIVIERGRFVHEAPRSDLDADKVKKLLAV